MLIHYKKDGKVVWFDWFKQGDQTENLPTEPSACVSDNRGPGRYWCNRPGNIVVLESADCIDTHDHEVRS